MLTEIMYALYSHAKDSAHRRQLSGVGGCCWPFRISQTAHVVNVVVRKHRDLEAERSPRLGVSRTSRANRDARFVVTNWTSMVFSTSDSRYTRLILSGSLSLYTSVLRAERLRELEIINSDDLRDAST